MGVDYLDKKYYWKEMYLSGLSETELPDKQLRWYFVWVERFEKFLPEKPLAERTPDDVERFLEYWSDRANIEDWQIRQASKTLGIFCQRVLPRLRGESSLDGQADWNSALKIPPDWQERFKNAMRSGHYAYRTERTYEDWIRRFIFFSVKQGGLSGGQAARLLALVKKVVSISYSSDSNFDLNITFSWCSADFVTASGCRGSGCRCWSPGRSPRVIPRASRHYSTFTVIVSSKWVGSSWPS